MKSDNELTERKLHESVVYRGGRGGDSPRAAHPKGAEHPKGAALPKNVKIYVKKVKKFSPFNDKIYV